jgi:CRISPR-associated endonuclease/helicase Cas3
MRLPIPAADCWGKLTPRRGEPERWHPLSDHCMDVAACAEAILKLPIVRARLASLAGMDSFPSVWSERLASLAFLHDFGKANGRFQNRDGGHIAEAVYVAGSSAKRKEAGLDRLDVFGASTPTEFMLAVILGHHGVPPDFRTPGHYDAAWAPRPQRDPSADVRKLVEKAVSIWPEAFAFGGTPLPEPTSPFWHAYLGLLQLADWLGSDDSRDAFPFSEKTDGPRIDFARRRARDLVSKIGFDATPLRSALARAVDFRALSEHEPTEIQLATAEAPGPIVVLESETGSGKTEAALWRFATLFAAGKVDGLYFALPTRVAASQIHGRVQAFAARLFPGADIEVVRALPGDASSSKATVRLLPEFFAQWSDDPDEAMRRARWSAERPKRFLAATIAVGTIDQALLGAVTVKHAQMRSFCLSRSLLVVDEVHASDRYMERLLVNLLAQHRSAGGEALLLSATLGSAARTRLLFGGGRRSKKAIPDPDAAVAVPYPALSWAENNTVVTTAKASRGQNKTVRVDPSQAISNPIAVAGLALAAAEGGAKVLVVRNLVRDAVATARALHEMASDNPALFRLDDIGTLHHGRFARVDRIRLDAAVEAAIGKVRPDGPLVLIGTQTLEQSLDIDADLLITDLAPIDVLLQRIGRLHRHERERPAAFRRARAVVLTPEGFEAALAAASRGRGGPHGLGTVYSDLVAVAGTADLIGNGTEWTIPAMNRKLVESATHPTTLDLLAARRAKQTGDPRWREAQTRQFGSNLAKSQTADVVSIKWCEPAAYFRVADERVMTRLGLGDIEVDISGGVPSPFPRSPRIDRLVLPAHLLSGVGQDAQLVDIAATAEGFSFRLNEHVFSYGRYGLERC